MDIIHDLKKKNIFFNSQQQEAILDNSRYLLLLAVPGSGKTTVMVSRIARLLLNDRVGPASILTMTFSREAAKDMRARYCSLFPDLPVPVFSTIHSFCFHLLIRFSKFYDRPIPQNIETEGAPIRKATLLRKIYNDRNPDFIGDDALDTLCSEISYIKNRMIQTEELDSHRFETPKIKEIYPLYEQYKADHSLMDFDDMLSICLDILERYPHILEEYQRKYRYINLDEAQDTSLLQHKIVEKLARGCRSLFMVGDEDQSIYSFRGASPESLLSFAQVYPDAKILKMEQNFRSKSEIVTAANRFIKQNRNRYEKEMFCDQPDEDCIYITELPDYHNQYQEIMTLVRALPPDETLAILYRNNESAVPLIDLFEKEGISFYMKEHKASFFSSFVVRDILSFFRLSRDPNDIDAFRNIYFKLYLSKKIYQYVADNYLDYENIFDVVLTVPSLRTTDAARIANIRDKLPRVQKLSPPRAIQYIEDVLGYGDFIRGQGKNGFIAENLNQKLSILKAVAANYSTIDAFTDRLQTLEKLIRKNKLSTTAAVTLSTMHSSKGLEFDHIVILDLIEGLLPSASALERRLDNDFAPYEEEVRLFYVAATRAKKKLHLYESGRINGCKAYPSRFLPQLLGEEKNPACEMVGRKIYHNFYKNGIILDLNEDTMTAEFELFGQKEFSFSYCSEHRLIKLI